jgi:hypothetical protein
MSAQRIAVRAPAPLRPDAYARLPVESTHVRLVFGLQKTQIVLASSTVAQGGPIVLQ